MPIKQKLSKLLSSFCTLLLGSLFTIEILVPMVTCADVLPWWACALIWAFIQFVRGWGEYLHLGLWIYSLTRIFSGTYGAVWKIIYFVVFAIYCLGIALPYIFALYSKMHDDSEDC